MITNVHIENFKSIENMDLPLGSLNILIGENGCGKTNILEAAAIGVAAAKDKLDNEYYFARGIRKTENRFMKSAFAEEKAKEPIIINFAIDANEKVDFKINENAKGRLEDLYKINDDFDLNIEAAEMIELKKLLQKQMLLLQRQTLLFQIGKTNYLLYAPENTFLRKFEEEGQIEGLGIRGEGLFDTLQKIYFLALAHNSENYDKRIAALDKYLSELESVIGRTYKKMGKLEELDTEEEQKRIKKQLITYAELEEQLEEWKVKEEMANRERQQLQAQKSTSEQLLKIKTHLRELLDWFEDFQITGSNMERKLYIKDRFLPEATLFDQKSANEGFLLLLFYLTLFTGAETPAFFAIDNIDTGLNPKLGSRLIEILAKLAKEHNKQAIITTHNPAILDGLDLRDDAQRLFVVSRNRVGKTKIERVENEPIIENGIPLKLSEKFMRGYIGGLPKNF